MNLVLVGAKCVAASSRHVSIDEEALRVFADSITEAEFAGSEFTTGSALQNVTVEEQLAFTFIYSALNFCFWGLPKWTIKANGQSFDGSFGLLFALKRALKKGLLSLSAKELAVLPEQTLRKILAGNVEIPLICERLTIVRELGRVTDRLYDSSFSGVLEAGKFDCLKIARLVSTQYPLSFGDIAIWRGKKIPFWKKAQLLSAFLHDLEVAKLLPLHFSGYEELSALADYKVPQVLRNLGILQYSQRLAYSVDSRVDILAGDEKETEIRAADVLAVDMLSGYLRKRFPQACPINVDGVIWNRGQIKSPSDKPYHRTRTTKY